jgi:uncharacterized protein (TIGR00730 family)
MIKKKMTPVAPAREQIPVIMSEMQTAADALAGIGPAVSLFGSARIRHDSPYYAKAAAIAGALAKAGFTIIAGGGPGAMEAANKGAYEAGGTSVGLNIKLAREPVDNPYQTHTLHFEYFYSRKATFFMHSMAYVALPGGFGTLDELFEALTLQQTRKVPPAPIVLVGSEYWSGLVGWIESQMLSQGMISPADMDLFTIEDDPAKVVDQVVSYFGRNLQEAGRQSPILQT